MVRLIDDLMDVSRITRGQLELRKSTVDLASVVQDAKETVRPLIESAGHQLSILLPPEAIFLHADPARLTQLVANLLDNAAKYSAPGGNISVTAIWDGSHASLTVKDEGMGITADMQHRVFDMFV